MRGKVSIFSPPNYNIRITPAYAGKSLGVGVLWIHDKDHPRLCGEKNASDCGQAMRAGSPPPMRGKVKTEFIPFQKQRITPAYAGKRDHPLYSQQNG